MDWREEEALQQALIRRMQEANAAYNIAAKEYCVLMEQCQSVGLLNADGAMALEKAAKLQQMAYERWRRVLMAFSALVVDGNKPTQCELLDLKPGVNNLEVEAESKPEPLPSSTKREKSRKHGGGQ